MIEVYESLIQLKYKNIITIKENRNSILNSIITFYLIEVCCHFNK